MYKAVTSSKLTEINEQKSAAIRTKCTERQIEAKNINVALADLILLSIISIM